MKKSLFAESPCFENRSLSLEISNLSDEIAAYINIILNTFNLENSLEEDLEKLQSIFIKYRIYFPNDWDTSTKLLTNVRNIFDNIYDNTEKPKGFIKTPKGKLSSQFNLIRVKTRELIRLFYRIEREENIDTTYQKEIFSVISSYFYYLAINHSCKEGNKITLL